jgi:hypothetical protein
MVDLFEQPLLQDPWPLQPDGVNPWGPEFSPAPPGPVSWTTPLFSDANGSSYVDDVVVIGRRNSGDGGYSGGYDPGWFDWDGYDTSGNFFYEPVRPDDWSECLDRRIDDLAEQAANQINRLPDAPRKEYGHFIWQGDDGQLHLGSRMDGDNNSLTGLNNTSVPADFGFSRWDQVVGIVHSHPTERFVGGNWVTVAPGDNHHLPNSGDWEWPDFLVRQGANEDNFRQYILHAGNLYEFERYNNLQGNRQTHATNANGECP